MKVFISADSNLKEALMDPRFGRCPFFQVYDTETKEVNVLDNPGFTASGGAGIQAGNMLLDKEADVLITGHLGPNAMEVLKNSKIKVITTEPQSISKIIKDYCDNKLT